MSFQKVQKFVFVCSAVNVDTCRCTMVGCIPSEFWVYNSNYLCSLECFIFSLTFTWWFLWFLLFLLCFFPLLLLDLNRDKCTVHAAKKSEFHMNWDSKRYRFFSNNQRQCTIICIRLLVLFQRCHRRRGPLSCCVLSFVRVMQLHPIILFVHCIIGLLRILMWDSFAPHTIYNIYIFAC